MLIITRKTGEGMRARGSPEAIAELAAAGEGLEIEILFAKLRGSRASMGLIAPPCVNIVRDEIADKPASDGRGEAA